MRLRLGFAVAAHLEPDILIVDEVLAVGDAAFQKKCLGKMGDVAVSGRTVLFVSHNMAALKSLCDKGLVLNKGKVVYHGGAIDAVSHYLDLGSISSTKRSWEPQNAPDSKSARLLEVELLSDGEISSNGDVSSEKAMRFAITYEVTQEARIGTSALLYNSDNTLIFASLSNHEPTWHLKSRPKGLYQSICEVPPNLLNDGFYSLTVILWEGFYESGITESDVLQFYVHEQGFVRGDYPSKIKGLILPKLEWVSKSL
jgi:lipopolysaccharide transport system ATP-binding protein